MVAGHTSIVVTICSLDSRGIAVAYSKTRSRAQTMIDSSTMHQSTTNLQRGAPGCQTRELMWIKKNVCHPPLGLTASRMGRGRNRYRQVRALEHDTGPPSSAKPRSSAPVCFAPRFLGRMRHPCGAWIKNIKKWIADSQ